VDGEVGLLDEGVGPDTAHEDFFFDELAVAFEEDDEEVDGFAREGDELAAAKEEVPGAVEAERTELPLKMAGRIHRARRRILELFKGSFRTFARERRLSMTHRGEHSGKHSGRPFRQR